MSRNQRDLVLHQAMQEIVRAAGIRGFRRLVGDCGGDPVAILSSVGLDQALLTDPDRYIPYRKVLMAFEEAARRLKVTDFGLRLAERQDVTFLGMLALAIQSSQSVREGLLVAARNMQYHTPSVAIDITPNRSSRLELVRLRFTLKEGPAIPQATEHAVAHLCKLVDLLSDGSLAPAAIHFRHARISTDACYREHFGQDPQFGSEFDGIALDAAHSRRQMSQNNVQLRTFVERFLIGAAPAFETSIGDQVREILKNFMWAQQARLGAVARILQLHPRTLQRRLSAQGETFESILDQVRQTEAVKLLAQPAVPLATVARALGFSDQPAMNRACRRWFSATPRAIRQSRGQRLPASSTVTPSRIL